MAFQLETSNLFEKDIKKLKKRGYTLEVLWQVVDLLLSGEKLSIKYRPHKLLGKWNNFYECHVEPDWLLIYYYEDDTLYLARTGTHSDLF